MAKFLMAALLLMSLVTFILMGLDKSFAGAHRRRIPEKVLFFFALLLGGVGGTLGMLVFRHKTRHRRFVLLFPLLAFFQLALVFLLR